MYAAKLELVVVGKPSNREHADDMRIKRHHELGIDEAKSQVSQIASELSQVFSLTSDWHGDVLKFRGSGVTGEVAVADDSIEFNVKLGFALFMMEAPLRSAINNALDAHLHR